jgi:leader peptidase (prepilin peptidase)/N-methyltransferase
MIVGAMFACVGYLALQVSEIVCAKIVPFADGPKPGKPPAIALIVGSGCVGAMLAAQDGLGLWLLLPALIVFALVACWYSDVLTGIIPDYFTIAPLVLVLVLRIFEHNWQNLAVTGLVTLVFGLTAFFSKGRGMGWGDVKLVALGCAVLGDRSLIAFSAACLAAVLIAAIRRRRAEPIAFAPYLAGAIAIGMAGIPIFPRAGI